MSVEGDAGETGAGSLHDLVRRRRLERGLTQRQAAERAGVSHATWQSVERAAPASHFSELTLTRVATALDLPFAPVFAAAGKVWVDVPVEPAPLTASQVPTSQPFDQALDVFVRAITALDARAPEDAAFVLRVALDLTVRFGGEHPPAGHAQ